MDELRGGRIDSTATTRFRTSRSPPWPAGASFLSKPHEIAKLPDHDLWMAFFHDPDGNLLALMTEVQIGARGPDAARENR